MATENRYYKISQLPGPKGLPLIGNLLQIDFTKLHQVMEQWADIYGDVYKFKLANKTVVAISNIELIHTILRARPKTYRRISAIENIARELHVNGVFTSEGEDWRRQRNITAQALKSECLRRFFPTMQKITARLYKRWSNYAVAGQAVDIENEWMLFTVDITTNFAFNYDINLLEKESDAFHEHLKKQLPLFYGRINAPFPYWHFIKLPSERAMENSLTLLKDTINSFISLARQRVDSEDKTNYQPANFLEALLLSKDEDGTGFSNEEIQGNIYNILIAGEDTTAHTLSWLLYLIAQNPDVQYKMQQEADSVLGNEKVPANIEMLEKLIYIEAVAYETLRLKGAAPLIFLESNFKTELDGLNIPKATLIMLITRHGALQEKNFTDALEFRPERWIHEKARDYNHANSAFLPFGGGARSCPGRNLAIMEMKMAMAMFCKNFSVRRVDDEHPVQEIFTFTLMPDNLKVKFEKR